MNEILELLGLSDPCSCFECGFAEDLHRHHVVPRLRGGTRTVLLCQSCHAKAHHRDKRMSTSELTREALAKKKERGERLGRPPFGTVSFRGKLVPGKDFETVRRVLELRSERVKREGAWTTLQPMSYRLIAERMTEETGSVWSYAKVARIVNQWGDLARLDREVRNTSGTDEREE